MSYTRGIIGQNTPSYAGDWEPSSRSLIDAAKVSRAPEAQTDRTLWRVYTKGSAADAGVYTLRIPRRVERVAAINNPSVVLQFWTSDTATEAKIDLKGDAGQFTLTFPPNTDLAGAQVLRPGYDSPTTPETGPWTREYVALMRRLNAGVIRGMDFQRTNGSAIRTAADIGKPEDARYGVEGRGGPPHLLIDLCNRVGADLWLNVPHAADDECVREYARLCRDRLDPARLLYVEYSNEVWNTFASIGRNTAYCKDQGLADPECYGVSGTVKARQWYGKRAVQIAALFREEFGAEAWRVRLVLAGQAAYPEQLEWTIEWIEKRIGVLNRSIYGIAVAPYFGGDNSLRNAPGLTAETFLAPDAPDGSCRLERAARAVLGGPKMQRFFALAKSKGVKAMAYEWSDGFETLASPDVPAAVNSDPRIASCIKTWADLWAANGGDVAAHFVAVGHWDANSSYGATQRITEWGAKAQALADASAARPLPDGRDERIKAAEQRAADAEVRAAAAAAERDALKLRVEAARLALGAANP
jgi:hypothetical protein